MSKIEVIRGAEEHWYDIRWNAAVEYKGNKYVIAVQETPKWGEQDLYHYDDTKRNDMGDQVNDPELHEAIIERLSEEGLLSQDELQRGEVFFEDEDEAPAFE